MFLIRLLLFVAFVYICDDFFCSHFFSRGKEGILLLLMFEVVLYFCLHFCWSLVFFLPISEWKHFVSVYACICVLFLFVFCWFFVVSLFIFLLISCVGSANIWVEANRGFCVGKSRDVRKDSPKTLSSCCFQHNIKQLKQTRGSSNFKRFSKKKENTEKA